MRGVAFALMVAWAVAGCAAAPWPSTSPTGRGDDFAASEVDEPPRLLGCAEDQGRGYRDQVTLRFVVGQDGVVDSRWIEVVSSRDARSAGSASPRSIAQAKARALTCRYRPGLLGGEAVRVVTARSFRIPVSG